MSLQGPYVWDEYWNTPWWPILVDTYGLHHLAACSVDGWSKMRIRADDTSIRRNVNPDRHARIRAKHFRHAEKKLAGDFTFDHWLERVKDANGGHGDQSGQMRAYAVVETLGKAFDACDWGVS